jgi:FtsH-binding integral membrane protein
MHHDLDDALSLVRVDFAPRHRQPSAAMVIVATLASLIGSLLADAALVAVGTAIVPSTKGFVHFRFSDYAKLTVIGVVVACVAWPIVTRMSSAPRWIYLRLAVVVTVVLLVPDVWILVHGEPAKAVAILMAMHLAIAVVTYNCMVRIARIRDVRQAHV